MFDVKRYDESKLLELANVTGAVFLMDQKSETQEIVERLKKLLSLMESMTKEDSDIFWTWVKHILIRGLPTDKSNDIEKIINESKEAGKMVYAIEEAIKEERRKGIREEIKKEIKKELKKETRKQQGN